ncbi:MAG: DegV family protein [Anaerolineales bacterium]|nr:DegV family protein [Anaerolineales bacterium]
MSRVRIVTDSTIRFSTPNFIDHHLVTIAPTIVRCGSVSVQDDPLVDLGMMHRLLEDCQTNPTAEAPTQEQLTQIYAQLQSSTDQILSIHTSAGLSDAVVNANTASQQFLGRLDIQVIDSQSISIGLGLLVQAAAEGASRGEDLDTLVQIVRGMIPRIYMVFFLSDLYYLVQNGLISQSQAILGNMLGIVSFLTMEEGHMTPMEKVRSRPRAIDKLIEFVCEFSDVEHLAILQADSRPSHESMSMIDRLRVYHPSTPITTVCYGPSISTIVGLDSLGVVVLEAEGSSL